jgi:cysteine synthase A
MSHTLPVASGAHDAPPPELQRFAGLSALIGNTPMLAIDTAFRGKRRTVFAKLESMNLTGSIKDRMALQILHHAATVGQLRRGARIIEATSGNTGISFAALGRALGHPVTIFMPDWMSAERIDLIRSFGAEVVLVSASEGGFLGAISQAEALAEQHTGSLLPRQFSNAWNVYAHEASTGPEIVAQLAAAGRSPDAFVAGVGTGGTVMGVGRYLRRVRPDVRVHPLEPSNSPTMSNGHKVGHHRIQGISDEFVPPIVDLASLDRIIAVDDGDAILMAQALATSLGLAVGISSGANFLGALLAGEALGGDAAVATVFADSNKKYLSTDLMKAEPVKPGFLAPEVALFGYSVLRRHCDFCPPGTRGIA